MLAETACLRSDVHGLVPSDIEIALVDHVLKGPKPLYAGVNTFRKGRMDDLADHPTVKPWARVADALRDCTRRGEACSTRSAVPARRLIAAEKTGRVGYGVELDPVYVDVAIRRWEALTGEEARHVGTGLTLAELARSRSEELASNAPEAVAENAVDGGGNG